MGPVGGASNASRGMRWRFEARGMRAARGQSLVEFAMVFPLFLMLIFAIVEYSLINTAIGAYNFAAKDAARYGAIVGPADANADATMLAIVTSRVTSVVAATPVEVDIFEATESGAYSTSALQDDYIYKNGSWVSNGTQTWPYNIRDDHLVTQDYLGVHIIYQYTYVTALLSSIGATITLNAISVQRIEPQQIFHHPVSGAGLSIAALDPPGSQAPLLSLAALLPLWAFTAWRAHAIDQAGGKAGWS